MCKNEDSVPFEVEISEEEIAGKSEIIYVDGQGNEYLQ